MSYLSLHVYKTKFFPGFERAYNTNINILFRQLLLNVLGNIPIGIMKHRFVGRCRTYIAGK